jgi:hypothetical protein
MKKHHLLLILLIAGIAAFQLNQARVLKSAEINTRVELAMLRDAVRKSKDLEGGSSPFGRNSNSRSSGIDSRALIADLTDSLESGERMKAFSEKYEKQLAAAPLSKLKEVCALLEKEFSLDQQ